MSSLINEPHTTNIHDNPPIYYSHSDRPPLSQSLGCRSHLKTLDSHICLHRSQSAPQKLQVGVFGTLKKGFLCPSRVFST
ncbi:hypothetical protein L1987_49154 [Smallanthus sonchifolius]|uniref:Uncharacterized protein n=1 Tax=Smallanthus sonchifolius TaxID=185202 RepID=A0ACB9FUT5_9ASTR|nr:hypothetical protein L1987_49154 [Smallanthus sonchifolius]